MPTKTKESSKTLMQKHLDRARDLGVELGEYPVINYDYLSLTPSTEVGFFPFQVS